MTEPNGDRPATQRELLQAQLDNQEQLFEVAGRIEQRINEVFAEVADVKADVAKVVGRQEGVEGAEVNAGRRFGNKVWLTGLVVNFCFSLANLGLYLTHGK